MISTDTAFEGGFPANMNSNGLPFQSSEFSQSLNAVRCLNLDRFVLSRPDPPRCSGQDRGLLNVAKVYICQKLYRLWTSPCILSWYMQGQMMGETPSPQYIKGDLFSSRIFISYTKTLHHSCSTSPSCHNNNRYIRFDCIFLFANLRRC
jgi:hypothetical protein